jgi:phospholipid-translocating ATPase
MVHSWRIRVGDILEVSTNERIPADMVILSTSEPTGSIFIKTDQLDGETDWKVRRAIRSTHSLLSRDNLAPLNGEISYAPACDDIYEFLGSYKGEKGKKEALSLDNTAWANTVLAAGHLLGIVIFTGKETRAKMNSRQPRTKMGRFDREINYLSKVLFVIMLILAFVMNMFREINLFWPLYFFRYVLLLASIIPISLRVNLDFCKAYFSYKISNDELIPDTLCRNSSLPEELGRVEYLLCDKTGTLTYNDMVFKKLSVNETLYTVEDLSEIKKNLAKVCKRFEGPLGDQHDPSIPAALKKKVKRRQECLLHDLATALILCNNVTPVIDSGTRVLQASSPDEIALVKFVESVGFVMEKREKEYIEVSNPCGLQEHYDIIANFPFSSETKRRGIIVRHTSTNRIMLYVKGADMVMTERCKLMFKGYIQDECDMLAREGLRTLVITQKQLTEEELYDWNREYEKGCNLLKNRQERIR